MADDTSNYTHTAQYGAAQPLELAEATGKACSAPITARRRLGLQICTNEVLRGTAEPEPWPEQRQQMHKRIRIEHERTRRSRREPLPLDMTA